MIRTTFIASALALAVTLPLATARAAMAQAPRTFLSAAGNDANNCTNVATPCRHFAAAYAATAASGEMFVLDPANYGSLTITHAVSIEGHDWASIAPPNNGTAITINASSGDSISIHGVSINGVGATGGTNGIVFNSGGSLTVNDCVIQNFSGSGLTGNGILIQPSSGTVNFNITDTTISNNVSGILYDPSGSASANGVIDHVVATANDVGIAFEALNSSGSADVTISNSIASDNSSIGVLGNSLSGTFKLAVDNTIASNNSIGIRGAANAQVLLGRSVVTGNSAYGVDNETNNNTFYTYKDNRINFNGNANTIGGSPLNDLTFQ